MDITDIQKVTTGTLLIDYVGHPDLYAVKNDSNLVTLAFQYKVLSVLPGSGMGISIATPSTQKVQYGELFRCNVIDSVYSHISAFKKS